MSKVKICSIGQRAKNNNTAQAEQDYSGHIAEVFIVFFMISFFHMRSSIDPLMKTLVLCTMYNRHIRIFKDVEL